jgi:hypothetical protein
MSHAMGAHAAGGVVDHGHGHAPDLSVANTTLPPGVAGRWAVPLIGLGVILLAVTIGAAFSSHDLLRHALAAYLIGMLGILAAALGAMFWVMAFHLTMAGWSVTVRRQFENVMALAPIAAIGVMLVLVYELFTGGNLYGWITLAKSSAVGSVEPVYAEKAAFLNPVFFTIRALIYLCVWSYLAWRLRSYSVAQDSTGNRWLSNKARFTSSWGMLAFALTTAGAAFDWIMSMDYRFFSTMWGVYYFAGAAFCSIAVMVLTFVWIQARGSLKGIVTEEHYHDLGKLAFGFTVFWAYIGFSQYFLIWYANIPEETFWMLARKVGPWRTWTFLLVFGHFAVPFYVLLWRFMRRTPGLLATVAVWMILMEIADLVWIIRPLAYAGTGTADLHLDRIWIDLAGIGGAWLVFFGLVFRAAGKGSLIPTKDPRLPEALHHRNYV